MSTLTPARHDPAQIDGGALSYRFLLGVWIQFVFLGGFILNFGIFNAYYATHLFPAHRNEISIIGTLAMGISQLLNPFLTRLALAYPAQRNALTWAGYAICLSAILLASFATQLWHLWLTQGLLFGLGWVAVSAPLLIMLNEWFVVRRGRAYGLAYGGGGAGILLLPVTLETLLERTGFRTTLRLYAVVAGVAAGLGLLIARPRRSPLSSSSSSSAQAGAPAAPRPWSLFLKHPLYYPFAVSVGLHALAFQIPLLFLPSFAEGLGIAPRSAAALVTVYGAAQILGQFVLGSVSDGASVFALAGVTPALVGVAAFRGWGVAKGYKEIAAFAALNGFLTPSFNILYPRMASCLASDPAMGAVLFSVFCAERGVASLLAGPIASALLGDTVDVGLFGLGRFRGVIGMFGICMLAAGGSCVVAWFWRGEAERLRITTKVVDDYVRENGGGPVNGSAGKAKRFS